MITMKFTGNALHDGVLAAKGITDGYEVSTDDGSATVFMNHHRDKVTMFDTGEYKIEGDVPTKPDLRTPSQWISLDDDGSVVAHAREPNGDWIHTTLAPDGLGLGVEIAAAGIILEGHTPYNDD